MNCLFFILSLQSKKLSYDKNMLFHKEKIMKINCDDSIFHSWYCKNMNRSQAENLLKKEVKKKDYDYDSYCW